MPLSFNDRETFWRKNATEALQRAYDNMEIRWKKDEKIIAQLKARVLELEERVDRCHQEHLAVVTENTELKQKLHVLEMRKQNSMLPFEQYGSPKRSTSQSSSDDTARPDSPVCPVCGMRFPRTMDQMDFEHHVNGHFDH